MTGQRAPTTRTWRRWAREPLLHFLLLGAALFGVDAALRPPADTRQVVVDAAIAAELTERLATQLGRPPTEEESDEAITGWAQDEILYREGLRRGFDEHDPAVRARVASRMSHVLRASAVVATPTDAELRAFFSSAPADRWAEALRLDFTHVFVEGHDDDDVRRADELLGLLRGGAAPAGLGDRFSGGRRYRGRELADLATMFGPSFVEDMNAQPIHTWALRRSRLGLHLVRIDAMRAARTPTFEDVEADVRRAWIEEREAEATARAMQRLMEQWEIVRSP